MSKGSGGGGRSGRSGGGNAYETAKSEHGRLLQEYEAITAGNRDFRRTPEQAAKEAALRPKIAEAQRKMNALMPESEKIYYDLGAMR